MGSYDSADMRKAGTEQEAQEIRRQMALIRTQLLERFAVPAIVGIELDNADLQITGASPLSVSIRQTLQATPQAHVETQVHMLTGPPNLPEELSETLEELAWRHALAAGLPDAAADRAATDARSHPSLSAATHLLVTYDGLQLPTLGLLHGTPWASWLLVCDVSAVMKAWSCVSVRGYGCEAATPMRLMFMHEPRELVANTFADLGP